MLLSFAIGSILYLSITIYIYIIYIIHTHVYVCVMCIYTYMYMYVYIFVCMHVCMYVHRCQRDIFGARCASGLNFIK